MLSTAAVEQARRDIEAMSRSGMPLTRFTDEACAALAVVVPFVAGCVSTFDPATTLLSSIRKLGALEGRNEHDVSWAQIEYAGGDPTAMVRLVVAGTPAVGLHAATGGRVERSVRMAELMVPAFDFRDEARAVFTDRGGAWGSMSLFRGPGDRPFSADEIALVAQLAPAFTRGTRAGLLAQRAGEGPPTSSGPAIVIVDAAGRVVQSSPGADARLLQMARAPRSGDPLALVHTLVAAARRFARGECDVSPSVRVRTHDGTWLVLRASPLSGADDRAGEVVITMAEARPQEVIDLVAAAFALTARERDVTVLVLRGADTREIARAMRISAYTVQDHLKSVFEKAAVTSRGELVARVFFDQYAPRLGEQPGGHR
ncbi:helix-turn-helix transcriptional regulator [Cellulomonas sp. PhB143]|uniref:helix-turn-helix transcriptional regulator n=1 Tax=Cellulomonas sp. PhB143 TaxID=2485186 RepID=UPI000FA1EE85|nr:helix-turn-helix transcriptional regulator [Cellulomonas sp. PhB143]ROS74404.1 DNA-binding CsgD family transcriptional regulator [Cellulomonas sp. PhB143]